MQTSGIAFTGILVWLVLARITRKLYGKKRQSNIAKASGRPLDDTDVQRLANNNLLATAVTLAMVGTSQSVVLMENHIAEYFSAGAIRGIAMLLSCTIALALYNLHPTQSDIREITSRTQSSKINDEPPCP